MKRKLLYLFVALTLIILSLPAAMPATAMPTEDWTFMVYMAADNNLNDAGIDDLNEMEVAGSTADVNIVALLDLYGQGNTNIYYVQKEVSPSPTIISTPVSGPFGVEVNMGDPNTLVTFVEWTIANYPANHYALVLWDHGSGWRMRAIAEPLTKGVCFDDTSFGAYIDTPELGSALSQINTNTGVTLDIVGFDACLMQMTEIAYEIRNYANFMVGSEEVEPFDGWPYDTILADLTTTPSMLPETLASTIVSRYTASYPTPPNSDIVTMSAVNLSNVATLASAINGLASSMVGSGEWENIVIARTPTEYFYYPDYVDPYDFADRVQSQVTDATVQANALAVKNAITNAIIAEGHGSYHPNAHGISIYFPISGAIGANYPNLQFAFDGPWDEFLSWYLTPQPPTWTDTITDPIGDQQAGVGPDIVGVDSSLYADEIAFQVRTNETINFSNFYGMTFLDTDQNPETGAPAWGIGRDYAVYVGTQIPAEGGGSEFLPKLDIKVRQYSEPSAVLIRWVGPTNEDWEYVSMLPLYRDANSYWGMIPLSLLGPDDGNMDVIHAVGTITPEQWTDMAPNEVYGVQVSINAPDRVPGDYDFTVTVDISQVENFDAANYDISFNPAVLRLDNVTSGNIGGTSIPVDVWNEISPGIFTIVQNVPGLTGVSGSGYLAVLHFHSIGSIGQSSNINLSNGTLSNNLAEGIPATWIGDLVQISVIPGDANGDGVVNAIDITKVERIIAGLDPPTPGADANLVGNINAIDITKVERIIAGLD